MTTIETQAQTGFRTCAISCLRAPFDEDAAAQARKELSAPDFDWSAFVNYLHLERISPLIYYSLNEWGIFPPSVEVSLKQVYLQNAWTNDLRLEELGKIHFSLQEAGIATIFLKGAALVHTIYERSALRPMCDIDLLVKPEDMEKTKQVLGKLGYTGIIRSGMSKEFENEIGFYKQGKSSWQIDLHSSLLGAPHNLTIDQMSWFWQNRVETARNGRVIGILDIDAQLLHLSAHLWLHHGGSDLLGINDIYRLILQNQKNIDWDNVLHVAQDFELLLPLQKVLPDIVEAWGAPVPNEVIVRLAKASPSLREKRKFNKFLSGDHNYVVALWSRIMSFPDMKNRINYAWAVAFPPAEYIENKFQIRRKWIIPFFYAYRLVSRVIQQISRMLKMTFDRN